MTITASLVKDLRERTGVGMMECKKALAESNGDIEKAIEVLRKQGLSRASEKSGRAAKQGIIYSYIHPGDQLGVLLELDCETDFVARTEDFQALVKDLAMHIAATDPRFIDRDEVTEQVMVEEREIYKQQAKASGKPDAVVEKIVAGKMEKFYQEFCLMEQPFVRDPNTSVKEVLHNVIAKTGENIRVRRFVRFVLGQGEMRVAQARTP
jgi:elongation factor Ts